MTTRAAVAFAAKTPLEIVKLDLNGPRFGEVPIEIMSTGIVSEVGARVTTVQFGDHVIPLYTPECPSPPQTAWRFGATSPAPGSMVRH